MKIYYCPLYVDPCHRTEGKLGCRTGYKYTVHVNICNALPQMGQLLISKLNILIVTACQVSGGINAMDGSSRKIFICSSISVHKVLNVLDFSRFVVVCQLFLKFLDEGCKPAVKGNLVGHIG